MYRDIVIIFIITSLWDVVLRLMATEDLKIFGIEKMKWVKVLNPYFKRHTLLGAALIAGFVGAVTAVVVLGTAPKLPSPIMFLYITLISGLMGFPIISSNAFPILNETYYKNLPRYYSFLTDSLSGSLVAMTYYLLHRLPRVS